MNSKATEKKVQQIQNLLSKKFPKTAAVVIIGDHVTQQVYMAGNQPPEQNLEFTESAVEIMKEANKAKTVTTKKSKFKIVH